MHASASVRNSTDDLPAAVASVIAERNGLAAQVEAMASKLASLAPHGTCGCSYDRPGDVCLHHSPRLAAMTTACTDLVSSLEIIVHQLDYWRQFLPDPRDRESLAGIQKAADAAVAKAKVAFVDMQVASCGTPSARGAKDARENTERMA